MSISCLKIQRDFNTKEKGLKKVIQSHKIWQTVLTDSTAELRVKDVVLLNKTKVPYSSLLSHKIADSTVVPNFITPSNNFNPLRVVRKF